MMAGRELFQDEEEAVKKMCGLHSDEKLAHFVGVQLDGVGGAKADSDSGWIGLGRRARDRARAWTDLRSRSVAKSVPQKSTSCENSNF